VVPYLLRDERVAPVARTLNRTRAVAAAAVRELLAGPTRAERSAGFTTAIPRGTRLRGITIRGGTATVDLSRAFASGGGSLFMRARVAQVVHTLTRFPTVRRVAFRLEGRPVATIGGEGVIVRPPVTRTDFEELAPAILVESPLPGARVGSPLELRGTSNTYEANFQVDMLGPGGRVLARRAVTATSGSGTRGTFAVTLPFVTPARTHLMLHAYENSAADGSVINSVRIPLIARRAADAGAVQPTPPAAVRAARARRPRRVPDPRLRSRS
jgi:hypothetical protein